jgi:hypothetical protein
MEIDNLTMTEDISFIYLMKELEDGLWIENPDKPERIEAIRSTLETAAFVLWNHGITTVLIFIRCIHQNTLNG